MRLLHPETLRIVALQCTDEDFKKATVTRKTVVSHAWCEVLKYLATRQTHPKMWLSDFKLGSYMRVVKYFSDRVGCEFKEELLVKHNNVYPAYIISKFSEDDTTEDILEYIYGEIKYLNFDDNYLFSDCMSLYFKGLNIFKYVYGDDWRRIVPVESLDEIQRQVTKTIEKRKLK